MTPITLTIVLKNNGRTITALQKRKNYWASASSLENINGGIEAHLKALDFGRLDSEGDEYLLDFLNVLPGDLIGWYPEET